MADIELMPIEIFEGGNGHLIFKQEWPDINGERYIRIMVDMRNAESICEMIMAVARKARQ